MWFYSFLLRIFVNKYYYSKIGQYRCLQLILTTKIIIQIKQPSFLDKLYLLLSNCKVIHSSPHQMKLCNNKRCAYSRHIHCSFQLGVTHLPIYDEIRCFYGELYTWFDKLEFSFFFFPFIEKLFSPVCSTVPNSLQGHRQRDCNKG